MLVFLIRCMQRAWAIYLASIMWCRVGRGEISCTHSGGSFWFDRFEIGSTRIRCCDLDSRTTFRFKALFLLPALSTANLGSLALTCLHKRGNVVGRWKLLEKKHWVRAPWPWAAGCEVKFLYEALNLKRGGHRSLVIPVLACFFSFFWNF